MDTFIASTVVILTLGSIGLGLANWNNTKNAENVNETYSEESIPDGKMYTFSCTWEQFLQDVVSPESPTMSGFLSILRTQNYTDYFLEMAPVIMSNPFKFVILDAKGKLQSMDTSPSAFKEHCTTGATVSSFRNLGKDALLVVPCPKSSEKYGHLSQFSRSSSLDLQSVLWRRVFNIAKEDAGSPVYISTDGRSIPWLHVRIENNPKYYKHAF